MIGWPNGNRVIEVHRDGQIAWSANNEDPGDDLLDDACGVQRLPGGTTVIARYHAEGDLVKLFKATGDKKMA